LDTTRLINSQPPSQPLGATTAQQGGIAIAPSSQLISVAIGSTGTVLFPFTAANASPIGTAYSPVIHPYTTSGASVAVAFDPQSRYLYVGETAAFPNATSNTGGLRAFSIGSGSLTEFSYTAPYASGGTSPFAIQPKSTGDYVYVANGEGSGTGNITGFQVITTGTSPSLSAQGSPATAGTVPAGLAEDNTKTFLLEVNKNGSPYLDTYTFDASTAGLLDVQIVANTGATPIAIVAAPL